MLSESSVLVLMGVSGSGKTTVGRALAARLGWAFEDADDYHSEPSRDKMRHGIGLTDADRAPWLAALADLLRQRRATGPPTVLACSALKARYREVLDPDGRVPFAWLDVPRDVLAARLAAREGHVAGPDLLPSQLATLETPRNALTLDGTRPVDALVDRVIAQFGCDR